MELEQQKLIVIQSILLRKYGICLKEEGAYSLNKLCTLLNLQGLQNNSNRIFNYIITNGSQSKTSSRTLKGQGINHRVIGVGPIVKTRAKQ